MAISDKTRKLLWGRSGHRCAKCRAVLSVDATASDDDAVIGDECHIVARSDDGPRADSQMPQEARDAYPNLILLCRNCHKEIDDQRIEFSPDRLSKMKGDHERWVRETLGNGQNSRTGDAQHYEETKDGIAAVQAQLRAIQSPLIPCGFFCTLKYSIANECFESLLHDQNRNTFALPNIPIPPLPHGTTDARVHFPGGFVDYRGGTAESGGIIHENHAGYNIVQSKISHRFSMFSADDLKNANISSTWFLLKPTTIQIDFFFDGDPESHDCSSLVVKNTPGSVPDVCTVHVLDNIFFTDLASKGLVAQNTQDRSWSVHDLENSYVKFSLGFWFIEGLNDIPRESWPTLHNLQLWMGPDANKVLTFSSHQLEDQIVQEDENPIVTGQAKIVQIRFGCKLDEGVFAQNVLTTA